MLYLIVNTDHEATYVQADTFEDALRVYREWWVKSALGSDLEDLHIESVAHVSDENVLTEEGVREMEAT
jgi:hypothetical protein